MASVATISPDTFEQEEEDIISSDDDSQELNQRMDELENDGQGPEDEYSEDEDIVTYEGIMKMTFPDMEEELMDRLTSIEILTESSEGIYQALGIIKKIGAQKAIPIFEAMKDEDELNFHISVFEDANIEFTLERDTIAGRNIKGGGYGTKCPLCESNNTFEVPMQARRSDEPLTIFHYCLSPLCGNQWKSG